MTKLLTILLLATVSVRGADILDLLQRKPAPGQTSAVPTLLTGLTQEQMLVGLKEALGKGVEQAVAALGRPDGYLKDIKVRIPVPANLQKVEKALRTMRQENLADEFVTTMNRAAEEATPQAAAVLGDAVKQMSIADAKTILLGTNNAATEYFRRTSGTNLYSRFLPIVKAATQKAGVTGAWRRMMDQAGSGLGGFGLGPSFLGQDAADLDNYVTRKALDGLFLKIGEQEKQIRVNPGARTTDLLQKVFGAVSR